MILDSLLNLAKGPLFRFSLAVCVLGLGRILFLSLAGYVKAYLDAGDKSVSFAANARKTLGWMLPRGRVMQVRPVFSLVSMIYHAGLIMVPLFLYAHIALLQGSIGFAWPALPKIVADCATLITLAAAAFIVGFRIVDPTARSLSRAADYLWPLFLALPFASGYFCVHALISPLNYKVMLLIHILSADLILMVVPFTKIAHCIIVPFSPFISDMGWRFPPNLQERMESTLGKKGAPL